MIAPPLAPSDQLGPTHRMAESHTDSATVFQSIKDGDLPTLERLFLQDPTLLQLKEPRHGEPVLSQAAWHGQLQVVDWLAARGAPLDGTDNHGTTALMDSAARGHGAVVGRLSELGASTSLETSYGYTALHQAASGGDTGAAALLLQHLPAFPSSVGVETTHDRHSTHRESRMPAGGLPGRAGPDTATPGQQVRA